MERDRTTRIALVTGASRGIGRAIAIKLAATGADVVVHYRSDRSQAETVARQIEALGARAAVVEADLERDDGPATAIERFRSVIGDAFAAERFDILINNAGVAPVGDIEDVTMDDVDRAYTVNFRAPLELIQRSLALLNDGGRIVNLSSTSVRNGTAWLAAYAPSKAALECATLQLAKYLGARRITVNAVRPGTTATELNPATHDPERRRQAEDVTVLGRIGEPEDVAEVVNFLASDAGRWVTGQVIDASGGLRI